MSPNARPIPSDDLGLLIGTVSRNLKFGPTCGGGPLWRYRHAARARGRHHAKYGHTGLRRAGLDKPVGPHTVRHAFITAALDAGVPLRDVQEAASDANPRPTMRYDRARVSLGRHATCMVAMYTAGPS
jgi:integrase